MNKYKLAGYVLILLGLGLAPYLISSYDLSLLGRFLALSIVAIGIVLIWGNTGILSLGQGIFFGLGGYAIAMHLKLAAAGADLPDFMFWNQISSLPWWWEPFRSPVFALAAMLILPAVAAFLLGWLSFRQRIKGTYFALITQAVVLAFTTLLISQQGFTGGFNGLTDYNNFLGFHLTDMNVRLGLYWVTVGALTISFAFSKWLGSTHIGKLLTAIRDGENRVRFLGYDPAVYKAFIFAVAAFFAGLAGALYTLHLGVISPAMIGIVPSIEMVIGAAIGGRESIMGAVAGTVFLNIAKDRISSAFPEIWMYVVGALFILVVLAMPGGVAGWLTSIYHDPPQWLTKLISKYLKRSPVVEESPATNAAVLAEAKGVEDGHAIIKAG